MWINIIVKQENALLWDRKWCQLEIFVIVWYLFMHLMFVCVFVCELCMIAL